MLVTILKTIISNFISIIDIVTALVSIGMALFAQLLAELGGFT